MWMRPPRRRSRTSWSSTTGPCWSPIHVAASPRSSVDLELVPATRSPTVNSPVHFHNKLEEPKFSLLSSFFFLYSWNCKDGLLTAFLLAGMFACLAETNTCFNKYRTLRVQTVLIAHFTLSNMENSCKEPKNKINIVCWSKAKAAVLKLNFTSWPLDEDKKETLKCYHRWSHLINGQNSNYLNLL